MLLPSSRLWEARHSAANSSWVMIPFNNQRAGDDFSCVKKPKEESFEPCFQLAVLTKNEKHAVNNRIRAHGLLSFMGAEYFTSNIYSYILGVLKINFYFCFRVWRRGQGESLQKWRLLQSPELDGKSKHQTSAKKKRKFQHMNQ